MTIDEFKADLWRYIFYAGPDKPILDTIRELAEHATKVHPDIDSAHLRQVMYEVFYFRTFLNPPAPEEGLPRDKPEGVWWNPAPRDPRVRGPMQVLLEDECGFRIVLGDPLARTGR